METKKLVEPKYMFFLLSLSWLVYFAGYLARLNYGAVVPEIIRSTGLPKGSAGLVSTGATIAYALGQIVSGILGDRFSPRYVMFAGLFTTSFCNFWMPLVPSMQVWIIIWCINGLAQAMLWPPMLRIFTEYYRSADLSKMYVRVSTSNTFGTLAVYLLAFLCVYLGSWKLIFFVSSLFGFLVSFFWLYGMRRIENHRMSHGVPEAADAKKENASAAPFSYKVLLSAGIFTLAGATLLHGALKESVTFWMPTFIMEVFHWESAASILSTFVMPVFSLLCLYLATYLNDKIFKNEVKTSAAFFAFSVLGSLGIRLFPGTNPILSLLFGTMITSAMYGANLMLITAIPGYFSRFGKASTLTGALNACAYAGTSLSTFGIGALSDTFGWYASLNAWLLIAALGTVLCLASLRRWTKFLHSA